jgi:CubicO group peptidase (beta-lactamase class C family)
MAMQLGSLRAALGGILLLAPALAAQSPAAAPPAVAPALGAALAPDAFAAAVRAAAGQWQVQHEVPGMSVAIGIGGQVVFAGGFGQADLENDVPANADTVYRLASISKTVTAVAALQLVEQGRLQLDGDVRTWVPEFPAKPWPVTLRQLLGHLGGVRHYRRDEGESTAHYATQREGLARFAADPLLHEPGSQYLYSTYGYNLVAAAVEAAAGASFAEYVQKSIAAPAGAGTLQDDDVRRLIRHRAQGYRRTDGALQNSALMDGSYKLGGGGLCCSAPDLVRFGMALLDGRLLSAASLQAMTTPGRTNDGKATTYGLGVALAERGGRREIAHSGAQARVSTALCLLPEPRVVAAVLCNLEGVRPMVLARQLADLGAPAQK